MSYALYKGYKGTIIDLINGEINFTEERLEQFVQDIHDDYDRGLLEPSQYDDLLRNLNLLY